MKTINNRISLLSFFLLVSCYNVFSQEKHIETTVKVNTSYVSLDTTIIIDYKEVKKLNWYQKFYGRLQPLVIYTGPGYLKDKIAQNIEFGYSVGMFDIGLSVGRNALRRDSFGNGNNYIESKITMVICQYGIYSNEMTIGTGYVFESQNYLMLELSYTLYGQFWKNLGVGIMTGFYDFSGDQTDVFHNTFGMFFRYGLLRSENGGKLSLGRMLRQKSHK